MKIKYEEIPDPIIEKTYICPVCKCRFFDIKEYKEHYAEHQRTGRPFVVSISISPTDERLG